MNQLKNKYLPKSIDANEHVKIVSNNNLYNFIDYDSKNELISDKLKTLLAKYLHNYDFVNFIIYIENNIQHVYWQLSLPAYEGAKIVSNKNSIITDIEFMDDNRPKIFMLNKNYLNNIIVDMDIVESIYRNKIFELSFSRVM